MTNTAKTAPKGQTLRVAALVYDGLCTFEYGIAAEVFGLSRPELGRELYRFSSVAVEEGPLRAAGGLTFQATGVLKDLVKAHTIIIPGWRGKDAPVPTIICDHLRRAHARGARLVSICSGAYVLAEAGLLDNKRATTHWRYAEHFQARFPNITLQANELFVDEGDIVSSAGSSAGVDACLHIVRCDYGANIASKVAKRLVMHAYRQGNQSQFIAQPIPRTSDSDRISGLTEAIRKDLKAAYSIAFMARLTRMSERTFQRRFLAATGTPPLQWVLQERVSRSCQLLETSNASVERISEEVGFSTTAAMRYHFKNAMQLSPNEYRKRFGTRG